MMSSGIGVGPGVRKFCWAILVKVIGQAPQLGRAGRSSFPARRRFLSVISGWMGHWPRASCTQTQQTNYSRILRNLSVCVATSRVPTLSNQTGLLSLRGAQRCGNLVEAEHTLANHHCYGDEIANPRIEYGVAMTKWVRMRRRHRRRLAPRCAPTSTAHQGRSSGRCPAAFRNNTCVDSWSHTGKAVRFLNSARQLIHHQAGR